MPTLLEINVTCNQGSTGKIAEQVGLIMKEKGWTVHYAHGARRVLPSDLTTFPFSSVLSEIKHYLLSRVFDGDGLGSKNKTNKLIDYIRKIKPDIVHLHNIHGYYLNYPALFEYLNANNIQTVITLHDCWTFTGHCTHFITSGCEKWKSHCRDCPQSHRNPKKTLFDRSSRNFDLKRKYLTSCNVTIVCVSDWIKSFLPESILSKNRIITIRNGIDLSVFHPTSTSKSITSRPYKILGVANVWDIDKGFDDILQLRKLLDLNNYNITLVGLTERQLSILPTGVDGITRTSDTAELVKLYCDSDVLINPTYADTYPTVNLESIACGTPVITYKTGGSPESITDKTGIVVERGDVVGLADAIKSLCSKQFDRADCCAYATIHFDKNNCFQKYCSLFESLTPQM